MRRFAPRVVGGHVLHVPPSHAIHSTGPVGRCLVVVNGDGDVCGHPCFSEAERRAHVAECARKHASAIHAFRRRQHPEIMQAWDPELEAWMGQHKDAILSGRMTV